MKKPRPPKPCPPGEIASEALYSAERLRWELQLTSSEWQRFLKAELTRVTKGTGTYFLGKEVIEWIKGEWMPPKVRRATEERQNAEAILELAERGIFCGLDSGSGHVALVKRYFPRKAAGYEAKVKKKQEWHVNRERRRKEREEKAQASAQK